MNPQLGQIRQYLMNNGLYSVPGVLVHGDGTTIIMSGATWSIAAKDTDIPSGTVTSLRSKGVIK